MTLQNDNDNDMGFGSPGGPVFRRRATGTGAHHGRVSGYGMTFRIRLGLDVGRARQQLSERAAEGRTVVAGGTMGQGMAAFVNRYLQWVGAAEGLLKTLYVDPAVWERLRGDTYWHIRSLTTDSPRGAELIYDEATLQAQRLDDLAAELGAAWRRAHGAVGLLTVVDTNVLLHYYAPDRVNWAEVVGASTVRLVLPLRVVQEIDEKKYTARDDLADWARRLLSRLWTWLGPTGGEPVAPTGDDGSTVPGLTVEVPVDAGPRRRSLDADQEVIDTCDDIARLGAPVVLVTGDCGMLIRASALGFTVRQMPDKFLRHPRKAKVPGAS
jgi:PIN domain-containing protein